MGKGSSFWGSFWRETGKNTGKWASNKVFGSGWSTPVKHIVERGSGKGSRDMDLEIDNMLSEIGEKKSGSSVNSDEFMLNAANQVVFNQNDVTDVRTKLDELLVNANMARDKWRDSRIFEVKIKSGIVLLRQQGAQELAAFYEGELKSIRLRRILHPFKIFALFVLAYGLLFFWWKGFLWLFN
jgi:hypothetical protein